MIDDELIKHGLLAIHLQLRLLLQGFQHPLVGRTELSFKGWANEKYQLHLIFKVLLNLFVLKRCFLALLYKVYNLS